MKRMYVTLSVILIFFFWAFSCLSQKTQDEHQEPSFDRMKRRMELREEMHRRMMDKLLRGLGPDQDIFKDMEKMFEDTMKDSFSGFDQISAGQFQSEWSESKEGRVLMITPAEGQQLDIDVSAEVITIKGKSQEKSVQGMSSSNFVSRFSVPEDCDGTKVKMNQKDGKILVELPFKSGKTNKTMPSIQVPQGRQPIKPSPGDIEI